MIKYATSRTVIRELEPADMDQWVELWTNPAIIQFYYYTDTVKEDAEKSLDNILKKYNTDAPLNIFAVARKESTEHVIGLVSYYPLNNEDVEIFGSLVPHYWGKKFSDEMGEGLIKYLFEFTGFTRILAYIKPGNRSSKAVAEKLGFNFDSLAHHPFFKEHEMCLYVLLKEGYTH